MNDDFLKIWASYVEDPEVLQQRADFKFNPEFYRSFYEDMAQEPELLAHYTAHGKAEGRFPNLFQRIRSLTENLRESLQKIIIDPKLQNLLQDDDPDALELVCEIVALGSPVDQNVSHFSGSYYTDTYDDIRLAGINPFEHYIVYGLAEGRQNLSTLRNGVHVGKIPFDTTKPTCLICVHETSKTGAPIVGLEMLKQASVTHNVIALALRDGTLIDSFIEESTAVLIGQDPLQVANYVQVQGLNNIEFAILNSVESFLFIQMMVARNIPFSMYIHEYTEYSLPTFKTIHAGLFSDLLVFSSRPLYESWEQTLTDLGVETSRDVALLPQSPLTGSQITSSKYKQARNRISTLIGRDCTGKRIIYGAGHTQWRKGTDLFVMAAQIAATYDPETIFIWMGDGRSREDIHFGVWLEKHLVEAGANTPDGNLFFVPSGEFYLDLCKAADSMFMPSRLDPLPNVVFDAVKYGCDVTLFRGGTGFDDPLYADHSQLNFVDYGHLEQAVRALLDGSKKVPTTRLSLWIEKKSKHPIVTNATSSTAPAHTEKTGPMQLSGPPFQVISQALTASLEHHTLKPSQATGTYDVPVLFSSDPIHEPLRKKELSKIWQLNRNYVWQSKEAAQDKIQKSDNWLHKSLQIETLSLRPADAPSVPEFCMHIHAHYTDELQHDLSSYMAYRAAKRIVVTTDTPEKAADIEAIFAAENMTPEILVVKNQGRDILPFVKLFYPDGVAEQDEIWCHIHQKKSIGSADGGDVWRRFLLSNLLGTKTQLSSAVEQITAPGVGLVTAFDPYLLGWNASAPLMRQVMADLKNPMPDHPLLFPVGNMFWVRRPVVRHLNQLIGMDYPWPNEPIENDGTIFHLMERLWPTATALLGLNSVFLDNPEEARK